MPPPLVVDMVAGAFVWAYVEVFSSLDCEGISLEFTDLPFVAIIVVGDIFHGPLAHPRFGSGLVGHVMLVGVGVIGCLFRERRMAPDVPQRGDGARQDDEPEALAGMD